VAFPGQAGGGDGPDIPKAQDTDFHDLLPIKLAPVAQPARGSSESATIRLL
jgi:hypothetical protein